MEGVQLPVLPRWPIVPTTLAATAVRTSILAGRSLTTSSVLLIEQLGVNRLPVHELQVDRQTTPHQPEATTSPEGTVAVAALLGGREVHEGGADP